jgi:hypothetical protein
VPDGADPMGSVPRIACASRLSRISNARVVSRAVFPFAAISLSHDLLFVAAEIHLISNVVKFSHERLWKIIKNGLIYGEKKI